MDKFIKEKLDKWDETENIDIVVPDSSACKNKIRMQLEARQVKKKRKMILGVSMGGLATVATILIIVFTVILAPSFVYTDKDLIAYNTTIDELRNNYGVLAISDAYDRFDLKESFIYKHRDTEVAIYSKLVYEKDGNTLELSIILVDNYDFATQTFYNNLTQECIDERFTGKFDLKDNVLYAKLNCGKNQYFLQFMRSSNGINEDAITLDIILALLQ